MTILPDSSAPQVREAEPIRPAGLRVKDAAAYLGISRRMLYTLMKAGELRWYQVRSIRLITVDSLDDYRRRNGG